jgi:hypothetical protein
MTRLTLLIAATVLALPAGAQTAYAPPGDTVRFREVTLIEMKISTPQGEFPIKSEHKATVAFARVTADSARAWYEALSIGMMGPMGNQQPATDSALNAPFSMRFDNRGRVRNPAAPKFPASFEGVTDLSRQFDDFFLRLPAQPLRAGLVWTDTSSRVDSTAEKSSRWNAISTYRVERDTTVDGIRAMVISMKQQVRTQSEGPMQGQPARLESRLEGSEDGIVVFAPQTGRLLGRRRQGTMTGDLMMRGGGGEMAMSQSFTYTGTLDAVRK